MRMTLVYLQPQHMKAGVVVLLILGWSISLIAGFRSNNLLPYTKQAHKSRAQKAHKSAQEQALAWQSPRGWEKGTWVKVTQKMMVELLTEENRYRKVAFDSILIDASAHLQRSWSELARRTGGRSIAVALE